MAALAALLSDAGETIEERMVEGAGRLRVVPERGVAVTEAGGLRVEG